MGPLGRVLALFSFVASYPSRMKDLFLLNVPHVARYCNQGTHGLESDSIKGVKIFRVIKYGEGLKPYKLCDKFHFCLKYVRLLQIKL